MTAYNFHFELIVVILFHPRFSDSYLHEKRTVSAQTMQQSTGIMELSVHFTEGCKRPGILGCELV